jgi:hypothetical protein
LKLYNALSRGLDGSEPVDICREDHEGWFNMVTLWFRTAMNRRATAQRRIDPACLAYIKLHLWSALI